LRSSLALAAALALACAGSAVAAPARGPTVERVVLLMRHSVRPPTSATVTPPGWAAQPWPKWSTPYGELTPHGAAAAKLVGRYDRGAYAARGLVSRAGCPAAGDIALFASGKSRSIDTAKNYAEGFAPGCGLTVTHPADENNDPIFHPLESGVAIDGARALAAVQATLPQGGVAALQAAHAADFTVLERVLGRPTSCAVPTCRLADIPSRLEAQPRDGPDLAGALGVASTAGQSLMLQYVEGMPLAQVGWGRAGKADLTQLLRFHATKFRYEARPHYIADRAAAPVAREILSALAGETGSGKKLTVLVGHDTNIAQLGGMLDLHWKVADYPADDPPPGGALGFELSRDAKGGRWVRAFYQAQSMEQLRSLAPLTSKAPPARVDVAIPGCGSPCSYAKFQALVRGRLEHPAP
jgi:4-phytase/acid phosphatase